MRSPRSLQAVVFGIALSWCNGITQLSAQTSAAGTEHDNSLRGAVLNGVTHEPIGHALVFSPDNRFATMTDDRGHFEFTFPAGDSEKTAGFAGFSNVRSPETSQLQHAGINRPTVLMARKPGFVSRNNGPEVVQLSSAQQELTISLMPEARVVGHVVLPGSDGSDRIRVELYRRQVRDGREHWDPAGTVMSRSDGEFRFAELSAGSYKLLTHELLDRDPLTFNPRGPLFGYPPVYYPAASDFATAAVIRLSPGETLEAKVSLTKKEYYPVKLGVMNASPGLQPQVAVWPQGQASPGYSLQYNPGEQLIEGLLPDGIYTIQASTFGQNAMTGTSSIAVSGSAVSGPTVMMLPNCSITVSVKEEFQRADTAPQGTIIFGGIRSNPENGRRSNYLHVTLVPDQEFGFAPSPSLRPPAGPVGLGASTPPIEITVRDDGAEVEGVIESTASTGVRRTWFNSPGQSPGNVYFVPMADGDGQFREAWISPDGKFRLQQLPPGTYRVLAFDRQQPDMEYARGEVLGQYDSKAQVVRVVSGQKEHLQLPLITANE